jgi:uncharacterized OsmC-like protein
MTTLARPPEGKPSQDHINGVDTEALFEKLDQLEANPDMAQTTWRAKTSWEGGDITRTHISSWVLGGKENPQDFEIMIDEPVELLGEGKYPNPQQVLFAAINACIMNTFVVNAAVKGIRLDKLEIELEGDIDLRGFLGIDESVPKGYEELNFVARVSGDGTREQYEELLKAACGHSPNYYTVTNPVPINGRVEMI